MKSKKYLIMGVVAVIILIISFIIFVISSWYSELFTYVNFDQLLFHLKVPLSGSNNNDLIANFLKYFASKYIIIMLFLFFLLALIAYISNYFKHSYEIKKLKIKIKDDRLIIFILSVLIFILSIVYVLNTFKVVDYFKSISSASTLFEDYYVNPYEVELEFPDKKKNLIYIYLESMESTYSDIGIESIRYNNLIPNLEKIANENIHFSNKETLGGAYEVSGVSWTIAALVSQTSGMPLKITVDQNEMNQYSRFLPGLVSLGDILKKEGYNNYFLIGSKKEFGGRNNYFEQHGDYEIFDYNTAIEKNKIDDDYFVWWGYEDKKLFEYAKEELLELASKDEPFNFTMLTADTHFVTGYKDSTCKVATNSLYGDAVYCSDQKIFEFINWLKEQEFYNDTTIIISGDHLLMGNFLFNQYYNKERTVYNAIINSEVETTNTKNRVFTTLDMFPTTLASLGVKIEGDRLGLGTNLFSSRNTLAEEIGVDKLSEEILKKSVFYDKNILYDE